jgi:transcriptional regulator with XRE-family HTH domain
MSDILFKTLGEKIKERRELLGYTQGDLAELTQISNRTIRSIEQGNGSSKINYWWKILDVLGLEMQIKFKPMSHESRKSV